MITKLTPPPTDEQRLAAWVARGGQRKSFEENTIRLTDNLDLMKVRTREEPKTDLTNVIDFRAPIA
jgi:hypothetical protein